MIAIIDYGMGNLRSVEKALEKVGQEVLITSDPKILPQADGIVLPGVGAFRDAMDNLRDSGLADELVKAINQGKPYLGICLGLQLLFSLSEEGGLHAGFDIIKGMVTRFPNTVKVPHIGWNQISKKAKNIPILKGIREGSSFYFVHSYYVHPEDEQVIATTTDYGVEFVSAIWRENIFAVQFHPEKSSKLGLQILKNFGEICRRQKLVSL